MSQSKNRLGAVKALVGAREGNEGRARQEQKDMTDVNKIVAAHRRGGVTTHLMNRVGEYKFVIPMDFRECMEQLRQAREVFDALPSSTRLFFANDPARFVEYVGDPKNVDELLKLGLAVPRERAMAALGSAENPIHTVAAATGDPA